MAFNLRRLLCALKGSEQAFKIGVIDSPIYTKLIQNPNFRSMLALDQIAIQYGEPMALLIQCCRIHFKTEPIEGLNERIEKTGEEKIEGVLKKVQLLSRLHRIRPVVYRVLLNANVSIEFKTAIKNELHSITLQNFEIAKETERIIKKLATVGITVIPYKGVAYSKQFYGDISMRESTDIDLAINPDKLDTIIELMQDDGYKADGLEGLHRIKRETFIREQKDFCFDRNRQFHVEFHWRITHPNFCIPSPIDLFENSNGAELEKSEHLRAIILHHWIHEGYTYLKTLIDIAQAIHSESASLDFKKINAKTFFGLEVASKCIFELFDIKTTLESTNQTANSRAIKILQNNLDSEFSKTKYNETILLIKQYYTSFKNQIDFIESNKSILIFTFKFWMRLVIPKHSDYSVTGIPKSLRFLYFFVRANRMVKRIFKRAMT